MRLGILHKNLGEYEEAKEYYKQALEIREKLGDSRGVVGIYNNLGVLSRIQGNYSEAKTYYQKGLEIITRNQGSSATEARLLTALAQIYSKSQDEKTQSINLYKKAYKVRIKVGDKRGMANNFLDISIVY